MLSAALVVALAAGSKARAESVPSSEDCLRRLERAVTEGGASGLAQCLAPDVAWRDGDGLFSGRQAALAQAERLAGERLSFEGGRARRVPLSDMTVLSCLVPLGADGMRRLIAVFGRPPWRGVSVYWAERGWPAGVDAAAPAADERDFDAAFDAFNTRFSTGDVAGWVAFWRPDAEFYSLAGPYRGADVRGFFEHQKRRYVGPHLVKESRRRGPTPDSFVLLGRLGGRCRANGERFEMPMLLLMELKQGKIRLAYEAFASFGDACGPFD